MLVSFFILRYYEEEKCFIQEAILEKFILVQQYS